jgi:hypothetical protein
MRRWLIGVAVVVAGALACAELVGVRDDLSCSAGDAVSQAIDPCAGESGVAILPASGELHALAWTNAALIAVGYDDSDAGPRFAVHTLSAKGDVLDQIVDEAGVANAVAVDPSSNGVWVGGGDGTRFMMRHYTYLNPLTSQTPNNFAKALEQPSVSLRESVAVASSLSDETLFGTASDGGLVIERLNNNGDAIHSAVFRGPTPLRATGGVASGGMLTILGDTPAAALGLVMARYVNGTSSTGGPGLDPSFGNDGGLITKFGDGGSARSLFLADDSSYWIGGQAAGANGFVLAHVTANGGLDQSWTASGLNRGVNAILAIDGGVLAAGFADGNLAIARFTLDAGIDTTFGDAGVIELAFPGELRTLVRTDDHYVAGGFAVIDGTKRWVLVWLTQ